MKNKGRLSNINKSQETKETRQLIALWYLGLDTWNRKVHSLVEKQVKSELSLYLLNSDVLMLIY